MPPTCFKTYDIRGRIGTDIDSDVAARIGAGFADTLSPRSVVVGHDARESSPAFADAVARGLASRGVSVVDIGLCGTEEVYFAVPALGADGGIMVTASHNPIDYNGMKLVGPGSRPLSDDEFTTLREAAAAEPAPGAADAPPARRDVRDRYARHVAGFADAPTLQGLRILANAGNGTAGPAFDAVLSALEAGGAALRVTRLHHAPDPAFPNGIPNPLLPENRSGTSRAVIESGADLGLAWDGDFDRCFFFDENGDFVDGEYVVALLAAAFLRDEPGATIVHDPRVVGAVRDAIARGGGRAVAARTGHAYLKAAMRAEGAVYGGEMSAHHYFRDFHYCDSGMIPWVKIAETICRTGKPLSALVADLRERFPSSGEINFRVPDPRAAVEEVVARLGPSAEEVDRLDGASLDFGSWRMNLRASNTEPLLRLNIETHGDRALLAERRAAIGALVDEIATTQQGGAQARL